MLTASSFCRVRFLLALAAGVAAVFLGAGCTAARDQRPLIAEIYHDAALNDIRNPIIVVPGVLGSRLTQPSTGKVVWGSFTSAGIDVETPEGMRAMAVPLAGAPGADGSAFPRDDVVVAGPLDVLEFKFIKTFSVSVYQHLLAVFGTAGYRVDDSRDPSVPGYSDEFNRAFGFAYDWRRDCVESARELGAFIKTTRAALEVETRARIAELRVRGGALSAARALALEAWLARGIHFDIVAHSMGALVARYWLLYGDHDLPADGSTPVPTYAGAADVDRLILLAPPNLGSLNSLVSLTEGYKLAFFLPSFKPALSATMPSVYQLLPRTRHRPFCDDAGNTIDVDILDVELWDRCGWGLLSPDHAESLAWLLPEEPDPVARRARAKAHVARCLERARQFQAALDVQPVLPCPIPINMLGSDVEPTRVRALLEPVGDRYELTFPSRMGFTTWGDGTVPRYSALGDDRPVGPWRPGNFTVVPWRSAMFFPEAHMQILHSDIFADNILHLLLDEPALDRD